MKAFRLRHDMRRQYVIKKPKIYVEPQFVQEFVKDLELQPVNTRRKCSDNDTA